jgi:hypothetical protein
MLIQDRTKRTFERVFKNLCQTRRPLIKDSLIDIRVYLSGIYIIYIALGTRNDTVAFKETKTMCILSAVRTNLPAIDLSHSNYLPPETSFNSYPSSSGFRGSIGRH